MRWTADDLPDLSGRSVVVTGANSGIGLQVAQALATHGARVVLACRDTDRGEQAARRIRARSSQSDLVVAELDLSSMKSVRVFADSFAEPLDLLVNNAGVMTPPRPAVTEDGFELQFGTNHLGHFVLTGLLLPSLLATPTPRVVTVSSIAHHGAAESVVDANVGEPYNPQRAYGNSKLANLLFARELQRQAQGHGLALVSTAAHPGVSATGLFVDPQGMGANPVLRVLAPPFLRVFTQSAAAGARAVLYAATEAEPGSYTGPQRLGETRGGIGPARLSPLASDERLARRVWQVSEDLTGFRFPWPA